MKSYKEYEKFHFGSTDIASILIRRCNDTPIEASVASDGVCFGYIVDEEAEIGSHYTKVCDANNWIMVYGDTGRVANLFADKIEVWSCSNTFIVKLIGTIRMSEVTLIGTGLKIDLIYKDGKFFDA